MKSTTKHALSTILLVTTYSAHADTTNYQIEMGAQTYQANNSVSIDQFDADFSMYSPNHSQLYAWGENLAYLQASRADYTLQVYKKQEIFINAGRETGLLYSDINARVLPKTRKAYAIDFDGYGIEQTGLAFSKSIRINNWQNFSSFAVTPVARLYNIDRYREIQANGNAVARPDASYDLSLNTTERDTRADFSFPVGGAPSGMGYAVDLLLQWNVSPDLEFFINAKDLYSKNQIKNTPTISQTLASNVNQFDQSGFLNYQPAIQGRNSRESYQFSLPVKTHLGATYFIGAPQLNSVGFDVKHIQGLVLPRFSMAWIFANSWVQNVELGYETHFESMDASIRFKYGGFRVGFDTLSDDKRRVEFLQLYLNKGF